MADLSGGSKAGAVKTISFEAAVAADGIRDQTKFSPGGTLPADDKAKAFTESDTDAETADPAPPTPGSNEDPMAFRGV